MKSVWIDWTTAQTLRRDDDLICLALEIAGSKEIDVSRLAREVQTELAPDELYAQAARVTVQESALDESNPVLVIDGIDAKALPARTLVPRINDAVEKAHAATKEYDSHAVRYLQDVTAHGKAAMPLDV